MSLYFPVLLSAANPQISKNSLPTRRAVFSLEESSQGTLWPMEPLGISLRRFGLVFIFLAGGLLT